MTNKESQPNEPNAWREKYDASAAAWDSEFSPDAINRLHAESCWRAFLKVLGDAYGTSRAIELGVGTGLFTDRIASRFQELIAVDFSQKMLDALSRKLASRHIANVVLLQSDAMDLHSVADSSADVVCCFGLLENIPDVERLFGEVARILKPRGRFAGVVSNKSCPWYGFRSLIFRDRWYWEDVRLLSASELRTAAQSAQLLERQITGWGLVPSQIPNSPLLTPIALIERVLEATPISKFLGGLAFCFERG